LRDFDATSVSLTSHKTGRKCSVEGCGGDLRDTIINFGESLNESIVERAEKNTEQSDVMVILGSSCTVLSASVMPLKLAKAGGILIIVNRQPTSLDKHATMRIGASCDDVMKIVANELNLTIPQFLIHRHIIAEYKPSQNNTTTSISLRGIDERGVHSSFMKGVVVILPDLILEEEKEVARERTVECSAEVSVVMGTTAPVAPKAPPLPNAALKVGKLQNRSGTRRIILTHEPFVFDVPNSDLDKVHVKIRFMAHYGEPQIEMDLKRKGDDTLHIYLTYDPSTRNWQSKDNLPFVQVVN